jgi:hypothetical protein
MSAYIVDKHHITYLIAAAFSRAILPHGGGFTWYHQGQWHELPAGDYDRAAEVANLLWRENVASVSARYPNESSATLPGPIAKDFVIQPSDIRRLFETFDPVQVLKSCDCYEYQSCEHDGWEDSEAHNFIEGLGRRAISALPGYEAAEWGAPEPLPASCVSLSALVASRRR